ncbi:ROK family protein [Alkalithermobacter paradoxus]|uniref:Beta-glucoside kinase n=1 Tax=Alkalithermobacter paradoxus TaxID=29349 RepID=A0A1V4I6R2_9FIRM|nr:beta-glucoside kinase [[Clostridium] thermoalcaliphilum]
MKQYLGIDIGGTYIKYGIYSSDGVKIKSSKVKTCLESLDSFIDTLVGIIDDNKNVDGIGISMPGFVDVNTGFILDAGAIKPLHGKNLKEILLERTNRYVDIENDANCVVLAEKWMGNGKDYSNFLALTIGTGIGGGIIIDNKLYRGHKFMAGEFGYMIVDGINEDGRENSTASLVASTQALVKQVAKVKNIPFEKLSGEKIFELLEQNDTDVVCVYNKWIERLALTIYNLVYSFNPQAVLIGGGVSSQAKLLEDLKNTLDNLDSRINNFVKINTCKFNNESGQIGAIYNHLVNNKIL